MSDACGRTAARMPVTAPAKPMRNQLKLLFLSNRAGGVPAVRRRSCMQDVVMLLFTVVFFALAFLYVKACQKVEVAHAHGLDFGNRPRSLHSLARLSHPDDALSRRNSEMSVNGWLQFAIYSIILLAIVRPVGIYMARVIEGERTWLDPVLRPFERLIYKLCGVQRRQRDELARVHLCHAGLRGGYAGVHLCDRAPATVFALEPAAPGRRGARSGLEHRGQFHHQHQLAVLYARVDHELSHRNGWTGDAQLLVGRGGHRGGHRTHPRHQANQLCHHR